MKKINAITVLIFALTNVLNAQTSEDSVMYKNEIGLNLIPLMKAAGNMGSHSMYANSFSYKRNIRNNFWLRGDVFYITDKSNDGFTQLRIATHDTAFVGVEYAYRTSKPSYQFDLGAEYRRSAGRITGFSGIDLGYRSEEYEAGLYHGRRNKSTNRIVPYLPTMDDPSNANFGDSVITKVRYNSNTFIISPLVGMQFRFSEHLAFSIQVSIPFNVTNYTYQVFVNNRSDLNFRNTTNYGIDSRQILNNFSLIGRF